MKNVQGGEESVDEPVEEKPSGPPSAPLIPKVSGPIISEID